MPVQQIIGKKATAIGDSHLCSINRTLFHESLHTNLCLIVAGGYISFFQIFHHQNHCSVQLRLWFMIHNEVFDVHDKIACYLEPFYIKVKKIKISGICEI